MAAVTGSVDGASAQEVTIRGVDRINKLLTDKT
jgi:hypothetical protein